MAEIKNNIVDLEVVYSKLNATIDRNIDLLKEGATAVDAYNKKISVVPSEFQKSLTDIKTKTDAVAQSTKKLEQTEKQLQQARLKELQLAKQREQAFDKYDKQLAREQAKLQASENMYNKLQLEMNKLVAVYQNLAIRKERGATLTRAEAEQMAYLEKRIKTLDTSLKAVDATTGKYSRNVGNYASGFNPLNNSIAQLGREMPAFANSVQTGFMAISNNLPIFFDAMQNVISQNKELQAQGQPTKSALSQLAGALFSFQTLLSVGVTLLTVYGKEIVNWVSSLWGASEALDELNKNQEKFNNAKKDGRKESVAERVEVEKYVRVMRNRNLTDNERLIALEKLRSQFPAYFKDLSNEEMLNGNIRKKLADLNLALERRASLTRATEANVSNKQRLLDLQEELKGITKLEEARRKDYEAIKQIQGVNPDVLYRSFKVYNDVQKDRIRVEKDIQSFQKAIAQNDKTINELKGQTILLEETLNDTKEKGNKIKKKSIELQEREEQVEANSRVAFERNISAMQGQLDKMSILNPQYKLLEFNLRLVKDAYEALYGEQKKQESVQDPKFGTLEYYEKLKSELQKQQKTLADSNPEWEHYQRLLEAVQIDIDILTGKQNKLNETFFDAKGYFKGFVDSFASGSGFSEVFKVMDLLNQKFETAEEKAKVVGLAISEAFQQAFNTISEASQANFDAEYARLEEQRDHAIKMAGGSATAREEIEKQYDERKKAIQRREAEAQKRLAIFNIVTNTAQAILATYAKVGFPAGIPLAIAMGAIGAFQVGLVASQEIPQFWKGTENAPEGLAWTQEKGAEVITDKSGNIKTLGSDKGAQLTYLSKGDKVYKSHEDYINKVLSKNGISDLGSYMNFAPKMEINNGITKEDLDQNFSKLASVIKNKDGVNISIDERGFRKKQGNTEFINSRLNLTSRQV